MILVSCRKRVEAARDFPPYCGRNAPVFNDNYAFEESIKKFEWFTREVKSNEDPEEISESSDDYEISLGTMKSTDLAIVVGEDDIEIEAESLKQPNGGYMYFYMTECQRLKEAGNHIGLVKNDVLEKWKSMTDAEKELYVTRSKMDRQEYKAWRKAHEKKHKVTYAEVEEEIKSGSYEGDDLKARVLLYLIRIFLYPTGDTSPEQGQYEVDLRCRLERQSRVKEAIERLKGEVGGKIDGVVKEVVELRGKVKMGEIKEMKSYVEEKYDELKKHEEEKMEEVRRKDVDVIYTSENVIDANLDSECPAPKKKQKVEKVEIPSGIGDYEAAMCDYLWNSGLQATWTLCYESKKLLRKIGYLPYNYAKHVLDGKATLDGVASFWEMILNNYLKFTDCDR
ncbi:hypothetical protein F3Y22_tig00002193pilonHSYRG00134 [Hibiscus syriacus]|uniref:HMG box domain-containing protein n=1 Tax=Hibiscus syriacus TaxID=106335 RepID=A0A6A3CS90_HIBSY|nr:hypothetical protein F3Y22_tig00002193pilonHSYRG00134 [Hibiscus syriacus]